MLYKASVLFFVVNLLTLAKERIDCNLYVSVKSVIHTPLKGFKHPRLKKAAEKKNLKKLAHIKSCTKMKDKKLLENFA